MKPNKISYQDAKSFLDFYLEQKYCISEMNGKLLDEIIYHHPQLALQYFDKFNGGK